MPEILAALIEHPSYALVLLPFIILGIQLHHQHKCLHNQEEKLDSHIQASTKGRKELHQSVSEIKQRLSYGKAKIEEHEKRLDKLEDK